MRLSSIFSSDTYQAQWRLSYWMPILLALFILAEIILRLPIVTSALPQPEQTLWHSDQIQAKLDYLKQFEANHDIDVLFIGNSTTQAGVDPYVFDIVRGNNPQNMRGAFNAAIEGLPPVGVFIFLKIYLQYTKPDLIIYGITAQDLNSNSPWAADVTDRVKHSPLALAESKTGLKGHVISYLLRYSQIYRYRFVLLQLLLKGGVSAKPPEAYFDDLGFMGLRGRLSEVPAEERRQYLSNAGVLNYSPQGEQTAALREIIAYTQDQGIDLILVNMPLADDYYQNFDTPEDYQVYLSAVDKLVADYNITYWDLENLPATEIFDDTFFADFNHLNISGAEKLSVILANRYLETQTIDISAEQR